MKLESEYIRVIGSTPVETPDVLSSSFLSSKIFFNCCLVLFFLLVPFTDSGCTPARTEDHPFSLHSSLTDGQYELMRRHDWDHTIKATDLIDMLGEPEKVMSVSEFLVLVHPDNPMAQHNFIAGIDMFLPLFLEDNCDYPEEYPLKQSDIDACEVWLYNWTEPDTFYISTIGGTVLIVTRSQRLERLSYAYVLYDSYVICWEIVQREQSEVTEPM